MDSYHTTFQSWDKVADAYQAAFMDTHLYDDTYDTFCQLIPNKNVCVLELGCGPGNVTKYLLAQRPDLTIHGIDISPAMIQLAAANNPSATFSVMDCRDIEHLTGPYDAIMCAFCMPYLSEADCAKLITDSARLLPTGGIAYFSTIEGAPTRSGYESGSNKELKMYVYYHQADDLLQTFAKNNLEVVFLVRKAYTRGDGTSDTHLIIIARKNN